MPRKNKWKPPTQLEMDMIEGDMMVGKIGPDEPDNINVAQEAEKAIAELGYGAAIDYVETRAEFAFHEEDREDWKAVERVIRHRLGEAGGK